MPARCYSGPSLFPCPRRRSVPGSTLYTKGAHFSSNCQILSNFVKSAFLGNHRKALAFKGESHRERSRAAPDRRAELHSWRQHEGPKRGYAGPYLAVMYQFRPMRNS